MGLIKVPSCDECKSHTSLDDEYFRLALSKRADVCTHPTMKALLPEIEHSMWRIPAQRYAARIDQATEVGLSETPTGIVHRMVAFTPDYQRLMRTLERITRGLYFHETQQRVTGEYQLITVFEPDIGLIYDTAKKIVEQPFVQIGNECEFVYQWWRKDPQKATSGWMLLFYGCAVFYVLVAPRDRPLNYWLTEIPEDENDPRYQALLRQQLSSRR